jgi:hypothetical protein
MTTQQSWRKAGEQLYRLQAAKLLWLRANRSLVREIEEMDRVLERLMPEEASKPARKTKNYPTR